MNRDTVLDFGKHRGKTIAAVLEEDPSYIIWLSDKGKKDIEISIVTDARLAFAKKKEGFIGKMINKTRQYEEDLLNEEWDEENAKRLTQEQAVKAMLYGATLTYRGRGSWQIMKKSENGYDFDIYEIKTGTKLQGVKAEDLYIRFRETTHRCILSCAPSDWRLEGKCWYKGCYHDNDQEH